MANGRNSSQKRGKPDRDGSGFVALPWVVLDSKNFQGLSHTAKSLLLEFARQYGEGFNGRLLCSMRYLKTRGFTSADVVTRAKRELISAGFIHETVIGQRPNKASWYAITWYPLDKINGYDEGAAKTFVRGAYRKNDSVKNLSLIPSKGIESSSIAPLNGINERPPIPPNSTMGLLNNVHYVPPNGNHLDGHLN